MTITYFTRPWCRAYLKTFIILIFFNWLFIVALTARSYRDCHWFSVFGNGTLLTYIFFKLSSHKWDFSLSTADIYRAVSNVVIGPRPRCEQPWAQATPSIMRDICRAVFNVVAGPLPTISITRPGNPIYELLYEFKLHSHLLGNLSHHFYNNGLRSRETGGEFGGIWAKLNINVEIVVVNFIFSQIAVGTTWEFINGCCEKNTVHYCLILLLKQQSKTWVFSSKHDIRFLHYYFRYI